MSGCYLHELPSKGRLKQASQLEVDALGAATPRGSRISAQTVWVLGSLGKGPDSLLTSGSTHVLESPHAIAMVKA